MKQEKTMNNSQAEAVRASAMAAHFEEMSTEALAWSETKWFADCPICGNTNELSEVDCVSGSACGRVCS